MILTVLRPSAACASSTICVVGTKIAGISDRIRHTNKSVALYSAFGLMVGIGLLWLAETDGRLEPSTTWKAVVNNLGGLTVATALLSAAWELFGKRAFAEEVMAKASLSADVEKSGITHVTDAYLDTVPWNDLMTGASKVDIVVAYANTWRNAHLTRLQLLAKAPGVRVRVFLPDPDDPFTMSLLANRFGKNAGDVESKVREAIHEFGELRQPGGADLQVFVRSGDAVFSCYRFDGRAVLTLYSHSRERRSAVPTLVVQNGDLWKFIYTEIGAILAQSRQVS